MSDGNSNSNDGDAAVAATIGNERAVARWVSDRPSMILLVPGGARGAYDGKRAARSARSVGLLRAEPAADENFKFSIQNSAGVLILSISNELHQNNHLGTLVGRRRRVPPDSSDV